MLRRQAEGPLRNIKKKKTKQNTETYHKHKCPETKIKVNVILKIKKKIISLKIIARIKHIGNGNYLLTGFLKYLFIFCFQYNVLNTFCMERGSGVKKSLTAKYSHESVQFIQLKLF